MNLTKSICTGLMLLFGAVQTANADIVVNIVENGPNIEYSYSAGTLDTTGLSISIGQVGGAGGLFWAHEPPFGAIGGGAGGAADVVTGFVGNIAVTPSSGWTQTLSGVTIPWSSSSGTSNVIASADYFDDGPTVFIGNDPNPAIVGVNNISAFGGTINGESFASLGLTANESVTFTWATDSLTFRTGIPEPSSTALLGVSLIGAWMRRRR